MDLQLPEEFDIIIVGTGMVESILSAAASRVDKRVLHVDKNDFYGGQWASFNLDALQNLDNLHKNSEQILEQSVEEGEQLNYFKNNLFNIDDFKFRWHIPRIKEESQEKLVLTDDKLEKEKKENWDQEQLQQLSRKFNIDLIPKLQYARGDLVELLISSNIARYSEYRSVSRVLTWLNGHLEVVPCSRSDVFSNNKVSVIEKRMLMKLLTSLDDEGEELKKYENKTFREFLKDKKLTPSLIHYVLYAISMSDDDTSCQAGVTNTKRFLNSLGRFGKTPFLFPCMVVGISHKHFADPRIMFFRLSAVFGGIFALGQQLHGFTVTQNKFEVAYIGILVTDKSVMESEKEHLTLLMYPPEDGKNSVTLIELGSLTGTCPKNLYIVHLISRQKVSPEEDFKHIVDSLFSIGSEEKTYSSQEKPVVLCSCYFSLPDTNNVVFKDIPEHIFLCPGPDMDLDYDISIEKAKKIFHEIYPDLEFLPRAPDPEEIVIEGEDEQTE